MILNIIVLYFRQYKRVRNILMDSIFRIVIINCIEYRPTYDKENFLFVKMENLE